jgi:hypothetical protein
MPLANNPSNGDGTANDTLAGALTNPPELPGQAAFPEIGSPNNVFGTIQMFPPGTYTVTLILRIGDNQIGTATSTFTVTP